MRARRWITVACAAAAPLAACLATPPTPLPDGGTSADAGEAGVASNNDATVSDAAPEASPPDAGPPEAEGGDAGCHVARSGDVLNDAIAITAGGTPANGAVSHACALRADGTVVCWGDNSHGQLGVPQQQTLGTARPVTVHFPADAGAVSIITIAAGGNSTFAIDSQYRLWAWGANDSGQLGIGTFDSAAHDSPALVMRPDGLGPLLVTSVGIEDAVSATCAVDTTGVLYCWGSAAGHALGPSGYDVDAGFIPIDASSPAPFKQPAEQLGGGFVRGGYHGFCFVDNLATMMSCWGAYQAPFLEPNPVDGGPQFVEANFLAGANVMAAGGAFPLRDVSVGEYFACALDANHKVFCQGFPPSPRTPAPLPFEGGIDRMAIGFAHLCGIASVDGTVFCYGDDWRGQIGNGAVNPGLGVGYPTPVLGADGGLVFGAVAVGAGFNFSCAIEMGACGPAGGGKVLCWGDNVTGQLGSDAGFPLAEGGTIAAYPLAVPVLAPTP
jgi:hypothetical protein